MNEENFERKIIIKICFSLILLIIIFIIVFCNINSYNDIGINKYISTTNYKNNYAEYINRFIDYCKTDSVEYAFNLLSDDCKTQIFSNNLEQFTSYINKYNFVEEPYIDYIKLYKNKNGKNVHIFDCELGNKQIVIHVIEYKPFDCKLYLVLE